MKFKHHTIVRIDQEPIPKGRYGGQNLMNMPKPLSMACKTAEANFEEEDDFTTKRPGENIYDQHKMWMSFDVST